jgi:hypothetical protein
MAARVADAGEAGAPRDLLDREVFRFHQAQAALGAPLLDEAVGRYADL